MKDVRVVYWFRTDLRLHDSPALKAALDLKPTVLYPIWTWDPHYVYRARVGPNRWQFLIDCQNDLSQSITKLNANSKLFVLREAPQTLIPKLIKAWKITHLVFEEDTDAYARDRDEEVMKQAKKAGAVIITRPGRNLYDPDELVKMNGGPTMTIAQVQSAGKKIGDVPRPIPGPRSLPSPGDVSLDFHHSPPDATPDLNASHRKSDDSSYMSISGPKGNFAAPTLAELGIQEATSPHRGGESLALKSLAELISDVGYIAKFAKPDTAPTAFSPQSTTLLSPHLHFGSLSVRKFYWDVHSAMAKYKGKANTPPTNLIGQLQFRDMYFGAQAGLGHRFSRMLGNPRCRFIPWHLPTIYDPKTGFPTGQYSIDSSEADTWFQRWKAGQTGFPWIDALMRQLKNEGWIHHLGRHAVACFLTRGGCYIDWERGAEVFEEWLIDHEVSCNAGNWQWLACTAFFSQYFRVYSPLSFPTKWDKEGRFVRQYVPELAKYDDKYIYEPWKAPIADQKRWGCVVKVYPKPMFDFSERRSICIQAMKEAYAVNLHGDDPRVKDDSWRNLFGKDTKVSAQKEGRVGATVTKAEANPVDAEETIEAEGDRPRRKAKKRKLTNGQNTMNNFVTRSKN